ncbi:MAG: hypothetical protein J1F23_03450 [Oscillospiraceae bacterium]|nr:hypothetical protein [Oscillospiraceae bacterium]
MNKKNFRRFYIFSLIGVVIVSAYPIYMGVKVIAEMVKNGAVPIESYPKYVIPYTPIAITLILGVMLIPLFQRLSEKLSFLFGAVFSIGIFFVAERLMETKILVLAQEAVFLESWQMGLCYVPPEQFETRTWEAVDVLLGGYSPAFKLHFYLISVVLIISLLNCFYGFAKMIRYENYKRKKALILQSITSLAFLGMCIWACFTSFYRTGELTVSAVSAVLMAVFFALLGVTMGILVGSFTLGKKSTLSILLPTAISVLTTLAMYIGEMILLSGNLYRFGEGFFFNGLTGLVLAPADLLIILISGVVTAFICKTVNRSKSSVK